MRNKHTIEYGIAEDPVSRVIVLSLVSAGFYKSSKLRYKTEINHLPNDKTIYS